MTEICYRNRLRGATILEDESLTNFGIANALDGRTSSQMGIPGGSPRYIRFNLGAAYTLSRLCIAGHNMFTSGGNINIWTSTYDGGYTQQLSATPSANIVSVFDFTPVSAQYVRVQFTNTTSNIYFSDFFIGDALDLPYGVPTGFVPPEQSDQDIIDSALTGNGAIAGITVTTRPKRCKVVLNDYESSWFESNWVDLTTVLKQYPIYYLWDSGKRAFFGVPYKKVPEPKYTSATRQSVTLDLEGFVE